MKKIILGFLFIATSANAQVFKVSPNPNKTDYNLCQENHAIILRSIVLKTENQIQRLIKGIELETQSRAPEYQLVAYRGMLYELIIKKIFFQQLQSQLANPGLKTFISKRENFHKSYLRPEDIALDLEKELLVTLNRLSSNLGVSEDFKKKLRKQILAESKAEFVKNQFKDIGTDIFKKMVVQVAKGGLKSITISVTSGMITSATTGTVIGILTMPLQGYRLPPEDEWTKLLRKHPELIYIPEWMKHGGVNDHPWVAHCNAIQRRTIQLEKALLKSLAMEEKSFINSIVSIEHMPDPTRIPHREEFPTNYHATTDNTFVRPQVLVDRFAVPYWAQEWE